MVHSCIHINLSLKNEILSCAGDINETVFGHPSLNLYEGNNFSADIYFKICCRTELTNKILFL
jgi:hypothetical protein